MLISLLLVACGGSTPEPDSAASTDVITSEPAPSAEPEEPVADTEEPAEETASESTDSDHGHDHDEESGSESDHTHDPADGVNLNYFFDGAIVGEPAVVDCTLSDGTVTECYEITIAGAPANHEIGPFCPETTETAAADAGIWFDGNAVYDADGAFILGLAELYNDSNWKLYNDDGTVRITDTAEAFDAAARPDVDPEYQNHCVAGMMEWLDNGEPVQTTVTIPIHPVPAERTSSGGNWGITLNGVIIAQAAPVDAILSAYTIAVFDDCGGHINPFDGYHLHGARGCSEFGEAAEGETPIFAYAMDGYPIHSALSPEEEAAAGLDECNGHTTDELGYHYHANPAEENSVINCFKGLTVSNGAAQGGGAPPNGGAPPDGGGRGGNNGGRGAPDFAGAAAILGISEHDLRDAMGGPPPNLEAAAEILGISAEEIQAALDGN